MRLFGAFASVLTVFVASAVAVAMSPQSATPEWRISATLSESCMVQVSCPCNFGGKPSHDPCQGSRLISIKNGHVGNVDLAGASFVITWELGSWAKIYVDDKVTDAQEKALEATVFPAAWNAFRRGGVPVEKAPIIDPGECGPGAFFNARIDRGHGSHERRGSETGQDLESSESVFPGLHPIPIRRPPAYGCRTQLLARRHERPDVDVGRGRTVVLSRGRLLHSADTLR